MSVSSSLVSAQNRVESPFIIVKIGEYTFGHCVSKSQRSELASTLKVVYPNFMESLNITKINGAVNTYTIKMIYCITERDDPNMLEKVFSSVANSRKIVLSYGDWNMPAFIYKEEEAIITKVSTALNMDASQITYTINCTSTALALKAGKFSFPAKNAKPSDELINLLNDKRYGLIDIFSGMKDYKQTGFSNFIRRDDQTVQLEKQDSINILEYISYLVRCMVPVGDPGGVIKEAQYFWAVYDDTNNDYGGSYFKVQKVSVNSNHNISYNTYEVDVGYPAGNYITNFTVNNNESWSILYNYAKEIQQPEYIYDIDNSGKIISTYSPAITNSQNFLRTTEADKDWWTKVTQFPITAKLTIKGLLRPTLLMAYVKVNCYFYGNKHISSGLYIITKQEDEISKNGYKTTLSLTRISGDEFVNKYAIK